METFLQVLGIIGLAILVVIGTLAGLIASVITGGNRGTYVVIGVVGALAAPFLMALLGVTALAAAGLIAIIVASIIGAIIVLMIAHLILDRD